MSRTRSLLLVGSPTITQALELFLKESFPDTTTASGGGETWHLVREQQPSLVLVQARLPDEASLLLIDTLASGPDPIPTVLLCRHPSDLQTRLAWAFGARGTASEGSGLPVLLETLEQVSARRQVFFGGPPPDCNLRERALLRPTRQQLAVLHQYAITPLRKAVASAVGLSLNTVDDHLHRLCRKLDADSCHALVQLAAELGLISSPGPKPTSARTADRPARADPLASFPAMQASNRATSTPSATPRRPPRDRWHDRGATLDPGAGHPHPDPRRLRQG